MRRFGNTLNGRIAIVLCFILFFSITVIAIHRRTVLQYGMEQQIAAIRQENAIHATAMNTSVTLLEENLFYLPSNNRFCQELARYDATPERDSMEYWSMVSNIRGQLSTLGSTCPYVESFFIYYPKLDLFLNDRLNPEMTYHIRELIAEGADPFDNWEPTVLPSGQYLLRIYPQRDYYLGAWMRCDSLAGYFTGNAPENVSLYGLTGEALSPGAPRVSPSEALESAVKLEDGYLLTNLALHPGVYLARYIPLPELRYNVRFGRASFLMVCLLHVMLLFCILLAISLWVLRPIQALSAGIQRIRGGEADYRISPWKHDSTEFQDIKQEFNAMMDETRQMRIQMYEQQLQQDEVKLRYLSQQIQPHFILNSLNMLYAYIGRDDELSKKLIRLLAQYYRYIINIESQYVQIGQEMEHLENYLAFQKVRYADRLQYRIDCDPAVRSVSIPPLLLESFVGNVLKYGQDAEDNIRIEVIADMPDADTVRIRVRDHGSGFPDEILDALHSYQKSGEKDELLGVGICNSLDRLKLIYNQDAAIYFYNAEAHGAMVEIVIHHTAARKGGEETA